MSLWKFPSPSSECELFSYCTGENKSDKEIDLSYYDCQSLSCLPNFALELNRHDLHKLCFIRGALVLEFVLIRSVSDHVNMCVLYGQSNSLIVLTIDIV